MNEPLPKEDYIKLNAEGRVDTKASNLEIPEFHPKVKPPGFFQKQFKSESGRSFKIALVIIVALTFLFIGLLVFAFFKKYFVNAR